MLLTLGIYLYAATELLDVGSARINRKIFSESWMHLAKGCVLQASDIAAPQIAGRDQTNRPNSSQTGH
jgi:hypothetical protein